MTAGSRELKMSLPHEPSAELILNGPRLEEEVVRLGLERALDKVPDKGDVFKNEAAVRARIDELVPGLEITVRRPERFQPVKGHY